MSRPPPLLATKLFVPAARADAVPRPRLVERLNVAVACRLALLSAPAGFGKTALLSAWAASCDRPVAWLALDEADDDPARFLAYLAAALQTAAPDIGLAAPALLASPRPLPPQAVRTALINDLCDLGTPAGEAAIALVLDDYHLLTAQPIHDAVTFLVERLPPHLRVIIATRADPPLPLARWRAQGHLAEIRAADLRFTPNETAELLNRVVGPGLAEAQVAALASRTEGWIAALQLAAMALRGNEDPASFVHSFTGCSRFIVDYLGEEVLQRQPSEVQNFLLQTAILDRLTGPLCEAVLGQEVGRQPTVPQPAALILEQLERTNLLVAPLDERREWYRYHRLFADLLRYRLRQTQPQLVPELHRRAAAWFEGQGDIHLAIDHALAGGQAEHAAALVERAVAATVKRGELATARRWLESLGAHVRRARPRLSLYYTVLLVLAGRPTAEAEAALRDAQQAASDGPLRAETDVCQAVLALVRGEAQAAVPLAILMPLSGLVIGALFGAFVGLAFVGVERFEEEFQLYLQGVNHGGEIVVVQSAPKRLAQAMDILRQAHAYGVKTVGGTVHTARRGSHD